MWWVCILRECICSVKISWIYEVLIVVLSGLVCGEKSIWIKIIYDVLFNFGW